MEIKKSFKSRIKFWRRFYFLAIFKPKELDRRIKQYEIDSKKELQEIEIEENKERIKGAAYACIGVYRTITHAHVANSIKRNCDFLTNEHNILLGNIDKDYYLECVEQGIKEQEQFDILSEIPDPDFILDFIKHPNKYSVKQIFENNLQRITKSI